MFKYIRSAILITLLLSALSLSLPSNAQRQINLGSPSSPVPFLLVDSGTGQTGQTGKAGSTTIYIKREGVASTTGAGTITEISATNQPGEYYYTPTATETSTPGIINFTAVCAGCPNYSFSAQVNDSTFNAGAAQSGASGTVTLATTAPSVDNIYNGCPVRIISGTGAGQSRIITGYVGSTRVATVDLAWVTTPDSTSVYVVDARRLAKVDSSLGVTVGTNNDKTNYGLASTQNFNNTGQTTKYAVTLLNTDVSGNLPSIVNTYASGQDPATLVLDTTASGHNTSGTVGQKINSAASATDPLSSALSGYTTPGTGGYVLNNYLNASVSAIKAKTDQFTFTGGYVDSNVKTIDTAASAAIVSAWKSGISIGSLTLNQVLLIGTLGLNQGMPGVLTSNPTSGGAFPNATFPKYQDTKYWFASDDPTTAPVRWTLRGYYDSTGTHLLGRTAIVGTLP